MQYKFENFYNNTSIDYNYNELLEKIKKDKATNYEDDFIFVERKGKDNTYQPIVNYYFSDEELDFNTSYSFEKFSNIVNEIKVMAKLKRA